jgi:hypothetical protein
MTAATVIVVLNLAARPQNLIALQRDMLDLVPEKLGLFPSFFSAGFPKQYLSLSAKSPKYARPACGPIHKLAISMTGFCRPRQVFKTSASGAP